MKTVVATLWYYISLVASLNNLAANNFPAIIAVGVNSNLPSQQSPIANIP